MLRSRDRKGLHLFRIHAEFLQINDIQTVVFVDVFENIPNILGTPAVEAENT